MSEFAGVRLSWERVIAAAKDLPDPASVYQEETPDERNQNQRDGYLLFALENIFTITSRGTDICIPLFILMTKLAVGYVAFMSTIIHEMNNECSISISFLKHIVDRSELPDGQTLKAVSKIIMKKSCINGYILWILLAQKFAGHLAEEMWSDEAFEHLMIAIRLNSGMTRLYAMLCLESFAMSGKVKQQILSRQQAIQQLFCFILSECDTTLHSCCSPILTSHIASIPKKNINSNLFLNFLFSMFTRRKEITDNSNRNAISRNIKPKRTKNLSKTDPYTNLKVIKRHDLHEVRNDHPFLLQTVYSPDMTTDKSGIWYYEVFLLTSGVVQVGWATPSCQFTPEQSYGVGDNARGFAFDTYRGVLWTSGIAIFPDNPILCQPGDVIGTLLMLKKGCCIFFVNGEEIELSVELSPTEMFPAVSLAGHQHIAINYGNRPWFYKQSRKTRPICSLAKKNGSSQYVIEDTCESLCILCYSEPKNTVLIPCLHSDFGSSCVKKLKVW
ncbi:unnamed protein product [Rhizopus stolonifer]